MSAEQATLLGALIGSPLIFAFFEFLKDKIQAFLRYRGWQAVFLGNDQVYFGKITSLDKNEITLADIYYLEKREFSRGSGVSIDLDTTNLIKLGSEVHGPSDKMTITKQHIIFTESLRRDSPIVGSINQHKLEERLARTKLKDV